MNGNHRFILLLLGTIGFSAFSNITLAKEIDASPLIRKGALMPKSANHSGHCKVKFDVTEEGTTVNINVFFCTDNVFKESAQTAVKEWTYNPRTVDGVAKYRPGVETQITYKLATKSGELIPESEAVDSNIKVFDDEMTQADLAYPWPPYFGKPRKGEKSAFCCVNYSVSQIGSPFNVTIESCSHEKFEESATVAIRRWQYKPLTLDNKPVSSGGYSRVIHFAKRATAMIKDPNGYTPIPALPEDYERYCRSIS